MRGGRAERFKCATMFSLACGAFACAEGAGERESGVTLGGVDSSAGEGDGDGSDADDTATAGTGADTGATAGDTAEDGETTTSADGDTGCSEQSFYLDVDMDGYGDPLAEVVSCVAPAGHVPQGDDCDDANPARFPGAAEVCDGFDNDCDDLVDEDSPKGSECLGCTVAANAGHAYYFCADPATFADARTFCMTLGGDLLKVDDQAELDYLLTAPFPPSNGVGGYRNGLSDLAVEGTFVWTDDTAPAVTAWNAGEPNDAGGLEDCVEFDTVSGVWNDIGCDAPRAFVCESL